MDLSNIEFKILRRSKKAPGAFSLFAIVKNESYLLPHFFNHYRKLGIQTFVIYDDHSTDGSHEFLLAQPDCFLITSEHAFGAVVGQNSANVPIRFGSLLRRRIPQTLVPKDWMLVVDADEFLLLPPGFSNLTELFDYLDERQQFYLCAPMVDFYPATLNDRNFDRALDPFTGAPYFDLGPYFYFHDNATPSPVRAGIRYRLLKQLHEQRPELIKEIYQDHPAALAKLWKIPLLKHGQGIERISDHEINLVADTEIMASLAHFKFIPDLDKKIDWALKSQSYYNNSMEYRFLQAAIERLGDDNLLSEETRRFESVESLVQAHLCSPAIPSKSPKAQNNYWEGRKDAMYLFAARKVCEKFCQKPRTVIDIGSNNTPILEWFRSSAEKLVSLDLHAPYQGDGITSIQEDFLSYPIHQTYDLATCFQVLEHIPDAAVFAKKLLTLAPIVVISVPYRWSQGACDEHVHDPVDEEKLLTWFGKKPVFQYVATEFSGIKRLIGVYQGESNTQ